MSNQEIVSLGKQNYMSNQSQFPIAIRSGKGICLTDEDGKEYLDFVAGIAVNALGYGNEDEKKALLEVIESGVLHTSNLYYNSHAVHAAKMLNDLAGSEEVFFCNSGAEANEGALKMARKYGLMMRKKRSSEMVDERKIRILIFFHPKAVRKAYLARIRYRS